MKRIVLLSALCAAGACKKDRPAGPAARPQIAAVTLEDQSEDELKALVADAALRDAAAAALAGGFDVAPLKGAPARDDAYRCVVGLRTVALKGGGELMLRSLAAAECKRPGAAPDERPYQASVVVERVVKRGDAGAAPTGALLSEHGLRAARDALGTVGSQVELEHGDPKRLIAALEHPDAQRRRDAIRAAAERRAKEAVPQLVALLKDPSEVIRDAALGALVAIGDPSSVKPLVKDVSFRDVEGMRKILDAVAQIGGSEALAYLEFVSEGHEDPEVKVIAKEALERLKRKQK